MPTVTIEDKGCRGCTLCTDICPVDVFELDQKQDLAQVVHSDDCIGCLSCTYLCPSECISVADVQLIHPFHRSDQNGAFVEKFLQAKMPSKAITEQDWDVAPKEVGLYLMAFTDALEEVIGRGQKAVGRRAGNVAAAHLPEMYEDKDLDQVLGRLRKRFGHSFPFEYQRAGDEVEIKVTPCGLTHVVEQAGGKVGDHVLCHMFHEYWAGLISAFTGLKYTYEVPQTGATCVMKLKPQQR